MAERVRNGRDEDVDSLKEGKRKKKAWKKDSKEEGHLS